MIGTVHLLTGAAIGRKARGWSDNTPLASFLAWAVGTFSHFVQDALPHTDPANFIGSLINPFTLRGAFAWIDGIGGWTLICAFCYYYPRLRMWPFVLGFIGAYWPDVISHMPGVRDVFLLIPGMDTFNAFHKWTHSWWRFWLGSAQTLTIPGWVIGTSLNVFFGWLALRALAQKTKPLKAVRASKVA